MADDESRKYPRLNAAAPLVLKFGGAHEFLRSYTENISLGGVFFRTQANLPEGSKLDLTIDLGQGKGIRAIGEVVWCRAADEAGQEPGVGIRFIEMSAAHKEWLAAAIKAYQKSVPTKSQIPAQSPAQPKSQPKVTVDASASLEFELETTNDVSQSAVSPHQVNVAGKNREEVLDIGFETSEDPILGIDLGTCNSCACVVLDGKPAILPLGEIGQPETHVLPSVVAFDDTNRPLVGEPALLGLDKNPRRTIFGAKRFIGRPYDSPAVHHMLSRFPYKIVPDTHGRVAVEVNGRVMALTDISAEVLKTIRHRCAEHLRKPLQRAIITVPAYYNDNQRAAVVHAGRLAGLMVERVLNEPTAAAIAYGLTQSKPCKVLVYDLGGGTFDVSIMEVRPKALQVIATAGDTFLGGEDFDSAIVEYVCQQHAAKTGKQLSRNSAALAVIKEASRKAKERLTTKEKTMITLREAILADGSKTRCEVELSRPDLEQLVAQFVQRTFQICELAIREAKMSITEISEVILVGGQTRMPYVREQVKAFFKRAPRCDLNPDEVVAMGAGLLAKISDEEAEAFGDVLSMTIGVVVSHQFKPVLMRNTKVPCEQRVSIQVPKANFETFKLEVMQGDASEAHKNEHLGSLSVNAVQPGQKDPVPLDIVFSLSADCLLTLHVVQKETNETKQILLVSKGDD